MSNGTSFLYNYIIGSGCLGSGFCCSFIGLEMTQDYCMNFCTFSLVINSKKCQIKNYINLY